MEPHRADRQSPEPHGQLRGTVVIVNPNGLHMRPAMAFARAAQGFQSNVTVRHGEHAINGKSLIEVMLLAAEPGTELVVEVSGSDAQSALPALLAILAAPAAEELENEPAAPSG
jgi:phosphotransferase system HPr (HPr) family protein